MSETSSELTPPANAENDKKDLMATIEQLKSTNERLLSESSSNKTKRSELESLQAQVESFKNKELEAKGDWQERLKTEQEKALQLQQALKAKDEMILKGNIVNAVSKSAKDAYDVSDLLAQSEYTKMIEVNEETLMPTVESVETFVSSLKEDKKYLFKNQKLSAMADDKPAAHIPKEKTMKQMSKEEQQAAIKGSFQALV